MATKNLREAFCLAYHSLPDIKGRGARAAKLAGYSEKSAVVQASQLLADAKIQARLDELAGRAPRSVPPPPAAMPAQPAGHPSETGSWPFSPPGADHSVQPEPPANPDPFDGAQFEDPKDFLRSAMNAAKLDPKLRLDAAKKLIDFEHAKLGEIGKKDQQKKNAQDAAGGKGRFNVGRAPGQLRAV